MLVVIDHNDLFSTIQTLLTVASNQCHWPLDEKDGELYVCGKPAIMGQPYCRCHCLVAFQDFGKVKK